MKSFCVLLAILLSSCEVYRVPDSYAVDPQDLSMIEGRDLIVRDTFAKEQQFIPSKVVSRLEAEKIFGTIFDSPCDEAEALRREFSQPLSLELGNWRAIEPLPPFNIVTFLSLGLIPVPYRRGGETFEATLRNQETILKQNDIHFRDQTRIVGWLAWLWAPSAKWSFDPAPDSKERVLDQLMQRAQTK